MAQNGTNPAGRLERLQAIASMSASVRGLSPAQRTQLASDVAQVLHSGPPGVDKFAFLRELLARLDAGTDTYADRIIVDGCNLDVLRRLSRLMVAHGKGTSPAGHS